MRPQNGLPLYKVQSPKSKAQVGQIWRRGSRGFELDNLSGVVAKGSGKRRQRTPHSAPISLRCTVSPFCRGQTVQDL